MTRMNDAELEEIHNSYKTKQERVQGGGSFFDTMPKNALFFLGLALAAIAFMMYNKKITTQQGLFWIAIAIGLAILFSRQEVKRELTFRECCAALDDHLKFLQNHAFGDYSTIPDGNIKIEPAHAERFQDANPWKRELGFTIETREHLKKYFSAEINIYSGDIMRITQRPEKFTGKEAESFIYLPSKEDLMEKKRAEWGGYGLRPPPVR